MKILILVASSERSSSDLPEYTLFLIQINHFIYNNQFLGEKLNSLSFAFFFEILPKFSEFVNSDHCEAKNHIQSIRLQLVFNQNTIGI